MPESTIAPDIHQPFDVHLNAFAEVAFNFALRFEYRPDAAQLVIVQILDASIDVDCGLSKNRACARTTDTVNVSQPNLGPFIRWKIDACYTCHFFTCSPLTRVSANAIDQQSQFRNPKTLSLPLFMLRVDANHPHHTFAVNDFALVTHFLY
jgi:hypothetical protein